MFKQEKGFTLIELLAVIVILGIIMMIAIPSVTGYITNSRKSSMIRDASMYINQARGNASVKNELPTEAGVPNTFSICDAVLESGGKKSPFGSNWVCDKSYVAIDYDGKNYSYRVQLLDSDGNYLPLTSEDDLSDKNITQVDDIGSVPNEDGAITPTLLSQLTIFNIGDFVNYDAGTWETTEDMPTTQGQFGGYEKGTDRGKSVTCYQSANNNSDGWRILSIAGGAVKLISAGTTECYHHTTLKADSEMILMGNLNHLHEKLPDMSSSATPHDWSYYVNSRYASKATIFTRSMITDYCKETGICASDITDDTVFFSNDKLIKTGGYYWLGYANTLNPYNPFLWHVRQNGWVYDSGSDSTYGIRPVITLNSQARGELKNGVWELSK